MCPRTNWRAATLGVVAGSGRDGAELGKDASDGRVRRVLVVDDSDATRRLIALNLELEGFEVHLAEDGQECLDIIDRVAPDVVTLDVMMPRLDGFATAAVLRSAPGTSGLPIV